MIFIRNLLWFLFSIHLIILPSCKPIHKDFSYLLAQTNNNKEEINSFLVFYSQQRDSDAMHLCEFFLKALPYQYRLKYNIVKSSGLKYSIINPITVDSMETLSHTSGQRLVIDTLFDINTIKAQFLIRHVNGLLKMRKNYAWINKVSIEDFCNYVAPYQVNNETPYGYQSFYRQRYLPFISDVLMKDLDTLSVLENYISPMFEVLDLEHRHVDFSSSLDLRKLRHVDEGYSDLEDISMTHVHALRSIGVPSTYEFTPTLDGSSIGRTLVSTFNIATRSFKSDLYANLYKFRVCKFYRNVFDQKLAINPYKELYDYGVATRDIPFTLNLPKMVDITPERTISYDIQLVIGKKLSNSKALYLATMTDKGWKIVSWSKVNKTSLAVVFKNMGANVHYRLASYSNGSAFFQGKPFLLDEFGNCKVIE